MSVHNLIRRSWVSLIATGLVAGCFAQLPTTTSPTPRHKVQRPSSKATTKVEPGPLASISSSQGPVPSPDKTLIPIPIVSEFESASPESPTNLEPQVTLLAGGESGLVDGAGKSAKFNSPNGIDVDTNGNIYVADAGNHAIRKITAGGIVTTLAGGTAGNANGVGEEAQFKTPYGLAVDALGYVYVADTGNHVIRKITPSGTVTTFVGNGVAGFRDSVDGPPQFKSPFSLDVDSEGNIFVADAGNHRIRRVTPDGQVTTVAGSAPGYVDGPLAEARFFVPNDLALTEDGGIFVADYSNHCIRFVNTKGGQVSTFAGNGTPGLKDAMGTDALFNSPTGLAIDKLGQVFVADNLNHRLRKIQTNREVKSFSGGNAGFMNGPLDKALFRGPTDVAIDENGNTYVADTDNNLVRKIR